jgi:phosphosulfolactate synthase (CoM biosynthesis protein A)
MTNSSDFCFNSIPIPSRNPKPRHHGLTMMIDWGLPYNFQLDCLQSQGLYVDEAKIAGSIPGVMPGDYLKKKIEAYKSKGIFTFPGGLFAEMAIAKGFYNEFLEEAAKAGFSGIEVSDNILEIEPEKKKSVIAKAVNEYGLTVMGEVGRKEGSMTRDELIADVGSTRKTIRMSSSCSIRTSTRTTRSTSISVPGIPATPRGDSGVIESNKRTDGRWENFGGRTGA